MDVSEKLVIRGKRSTITLDADAGGIWFQANGQPADCNLLSIYVGDSSETPYIGLYGPKRHDHAACDVAISVQADGSGVIQARRPDGTVVVAKIADVIDHVFNRHLAATPELQETLA